MHLNYPEIRKPLPTFTPMHLAHTIQDAQLWLRWVGATTIGGIGGEILALSTGTASTLIAFLMVSAISAAAQWVLLKRYMPKVGWWVTLSAIGGMLGALFVAATTIAVGFAVGVVLSSVPFLGGITGDGQNFGYVAVLGTITIASLGQGALIGALQWLMLRANVRHAGMWIPASALGSLIAGIVTFFAPSLMELDRVSMAILNTGLGQGIVAAATGIALIRILNGNLPATLRRE